MNEDRLDRGEVSRRGVLARVGAWAGVATLLGTSEARAAGTARGTPFPRNALVVGVALDGRTFRLNKIEQGTLGPPVRGDSFIIDGKIYPHRVVERRLSGPDQAGSVGSWNCRAWFLDDVVPDIPPRLVSTQVFLFDNGDTLITDGPEGAPSLTRAVVGGTGAFSGAGGSVYQEVIGFNDTFQNMGTLPGGEPILVPAQNYRGVFILR